MAFSSFRKELKEFKRCFVPVVLFILVAGVCVGVSDYCANPNIVYWCSYLNILLLILAVWTVVWVWRSGRVNLSRMKSVSILLFSFFSGMIIWFLFSYKSYYNGVSANIKQSKKVITEAYCGILTSEIFDDEKKIRIKEISEDGKRVEFTIYKNGEEYYVKQAAPSSVDYIKENVFNAEVGQVGNDHYSIEYNIYNKPYPVRGFLRAVTFSVCPTFYEIENSIWHDNNFIKLGNYRRSMNFYVLFLPMYILLTIIFFFYEKLSNAKKDLEQQNLKLHNMELTYNKIEKDFSGVVSNSQNNLQHAISNFDKKENDATLEEIYTSAAGLGRHDVINRIIKLPYRTRLGDDTPPLVAFKALLHRIEQDYHIENFTVELFDIVIKPWIKEIRDELKGLESTLSMETKVYTIKTVMAEVSKAVPTESDENSTGLALHIDLGEHDMEVRTCNVNLNKIRSIVFNLISNSNKANDDYKSKLRERARRKEITKEEVKIYKPKVWVDAWIDKDILCIRVKDNGGGFPEEILDKIYREPVATTKDDRDHGEGTAYIGFFSRLMNIKIEAVNIDGGACTTIFIPTKLKDGEYVL